MRDLVWGYAVATLDSASEVGAADRVASRMVGVGLSQLVNHAWCLQCVQRFVQ